MKIRIALTLVLMAAFTLGMVSASTTNVALSPGDNALVTCAGGIGVTAQPGSVNVVCPQNTATATATSANTPTATATTLPSATPTATVSACCAAFWHAPGGGHEHGDAPPAWVTNAGYTPSFTWPGNTPNENSISTKHSAFKGFSGRLNGVDVYAIFHFDVNPGGDASRFHSFQVWMHDPSGGVSAVSGWMDLGPDNTTQTGPNIFRFGCGEDGGLRPVIEVNVQTCPGGAAPTQGLAFDTWYPRAGGHLGQAGWYPDFGLSSSSTYYFGGVPTDPSTWIPTGNLNLTRRLEFSWFANRSAQRGAFWATQFGHIVSGPSDPLCGTPYVVGSRTYTIVCLSEYIAPTAVTVQYPGNAFQKTYDGTGVNPPN